MFCRSLFVFMYLFFSPWPCLFFFDLQILITFGIFWPWPCLFFFDLQILITSLVSFGHCVVCYSLNYRFWLPLWYLLAIVLSVILWFTDSDYLFGIFWPLCCLFFFDLQILITSLVSFGHCVVYSSLIYRFWLPLWYLLAIVLSVLLWFTESFYVIFCRPLLVLLSFYFWPWYCLPLNLGFLITPLVSSSYY
jgi:hypothetical protein